MSEIGYTDPGPLGKVSWNSMLTRRKYNTDSKRQIVETITQKHSVIQAFFKEGTLFFS